MNYKQSLQEFCLISFGGLLVCGVIVLSILSLGYYQATSMVLAGGSGLQITANINPRQSTLRGSELQPATTTDFTGQGDDNTITNALQPTSEGRELQ